jgi:hypothetical protein
MHFCYALLFWYGATLIVAGEIDFIQLMTALLALMLGALGLGQALNDLGDQKEGLMAAQRIFRAIDEGKASLIDGLSDLGECFGYILLGCSVISVPFIIFLLTLLLCAFGWSTFLCRIRFCDTLVVIFFK